MEKTQQEEERNEQERQKEHKFALIGENVVECISCELKHGGLINPGREELKEDGHIYAIRDFGKHKRGDKII